MRYNAREISGSTTPSLPQAPMPAPSNHHCNTVAAIIVIAVVIVATIYTAGAAAEAWGAVGASAGSGAGGTFAAGAAVLSGEAGLTGAALGAAAIGGAVGNAAGQLVGDALGVHRGFSFAEAFGAGLGAGITAGLGAEISGGVKIADLAKEGAVGYAKIAGMGATGAIGGYAGEKIVGEPAHFSWANVAAAALSTEATTALGLNSTLAQKWGQAAGGSFAGNLVGGLVNGAIESETARLLGGSAANGRQIFEDAFGNALGNAAIAGIQASNAESQRKQAKPTSQLLAADNPHAGVDPVAAFLSGPYASDFGYGDSLAGFDPMQGPLLAAAGPTDVYQAIHGPVGPIDVTVPSFKANPSAGALDQLDYDARWMSYAQQMKAQGYAVDLDSIAAAQTAYNAAAGSDTAANGGQYDPAKVRALDAALNDMIDANGWSFGPPENQIKTLPEVTVTPSATELAQARVAAGSHGGSTFNLFQGLYGGAGGWSNDGSALSDFASPAPGWIGSLYGSQTTGPRSGAVDSAVMGLNLAGSTATGVGLLAGRFGQPWIFKWESNPGLYASVVANNGGRVPEWLAGPTLKAQVATDLTKLRTAPYALDLRTVGKAAKPLSKLGMGLGAVSVGIEVIDGYRRNDYAEMAHAVVGGLFLAAGAAFPVGGFVLGLAWTGADSFAQRYTYHGQNGWTAVIKSAKDKSFNAWDALWRAQAEMQRQNPEAYRQLWSQPKL